MEQSSHQPPSPPPHVLHSDKVQYFEAVLRGKEGECLKERVERLETEREERNELMLKALEHITSMKDCLSRVIEGLDGEKDETFDKGGEEESRVLLEEARLVSMLANEVESRVDKHRELRKKEKRELESSLISLTEENRDVNNLLRVALLEKEALEKRVKGHDHSKRMPLLQFAEFGLQKVGFGFMVGGGGTTNEQSIETKSDSSECEEVVSLASTVERIMKNLRLEISQLRRSLEEARLHNLQEEKEGLDAHIQNYLHNFTLIWSDTERLQCLTEKQAKEIVENKLYIKDLEDRERILAQNLEEFMIEIKEAEEEVARWKEACELEVVAGKNEIEQRDKVVVALKQELKKTKAALDISNGKLRLKEELAATAIAAQEAAERSLGLADRRAVELRQRIEELTRQLEEAEKRERGSHKARHICWPWQVFKLSSGSNVKRMLPEMHALVY